jgi:hypothetical protein
MIRVSDIIQDVLQKKTSFGLPGGVGAPLNPVCLRCCGCSAGPSWMYSRIVFVSVMSPGVDDYECSCGLETSS